MTRYQSDGGLRNCSLSFLNRETELMTKCRPEHLCENTKNKLRSYSNKVIAKPKINSSERCSTPVHASPLQQHSAGQLGGNAPHQHSSFEMEKCVDQLLNHAPRVPACLGRYTRDWFLPPLNQSTD